MQLNRLILLGLMGMLTLLTLWHCAQPGRLTGGPKDIIPPKLNTAESSPNLQTNFEKKTITLMFDEFIKLEKVFTEVVISPPLEYSPDIQVKKKSVLIDFDEKETLRPNATYTINFGEAVRDFTEGNIVEDLTYVFSTGDFIDSLSVEGTVTDAVTGKTVEKAIVMLYENLSDSVVYKELPFYFGRADKDGKFTINNVKAGAFKVVALLESFTNYKFDNAGESIGFLDEPIIVSDTTQNNLKISIFQEAVFNRITRIDSSSYGRLKLFFSDDPKFATLDYTAAFDEEIYRENIEDTLFVWHNTLDTIGWPLYVAVDTLLDTIQVRNIDRDSFIKKTILKTTKESSTSATKINPLRPLMLTFSEPLGMVDTAHIKLWMAIDTTTSSVPTTDSLQVDTLNNLETDSLSLTDTLNQITITEVKSDSLSSEKQENKGTLVESLAVTIDSADRRNLKIDMPWKADAIYTLQLMPEAVRSLRGLIYKDTFIQKYEPLPALDFGDITLNIRGIDSSQSYFLEVLFKNDNLVESFSVANDTLVTKKIVALPSGQYQLRVTKDRNANGRWDTGNYIRREQPEQQKIKMLEELRQGWEVEADIDLEGLFSGKVTLPPKKEEEQEKEEE